MFLLYKTCLQTNITKKKENVTVHSNRQPIAKQHHTLQNGGGLKERWKEGGSTC